MGVNGGTYFGQFLFFSYFVIVCWGCYKVLIIPKWLFKVPGHIPIFVGTFLELPIFVGIFLGTFLEHL